MQQQQNVLISQTKSNTGKKALSLSFTTTTTQNRDNPLKKSHPILTYNVLCKTVIKKLNKKSYFEGG